MGYDRATMALRLMVSVALLVACRGSDERPETTAEATAEAASAAVEAWFQAVLRGDCAHVRAVTVPRIDGAQCASLVEEFEHREAELLGIERATRDGRIADGFVVSTKLLFPRKQPREHIWKMRAQRRGSRWEIMRP